MKKALLLIVFSLFFQSVFSSHYMGGEITWECLPNGKFRFILKLYRECYYGTGAAATFGNSESLQSTSPAGTILMNKKIGWPIDISPKCNSNAAFQHIVCVGMINSGENKGAVQEYYYTTDDSYPNGVVLNGTPPATGWMFYHSNCCRNNCTNISSASSLGWRLRSIMYPYNNQSTNQCYDWSPKFSEPPVSVLCTGNQITLNNTVYDYELDSLKYEWGQPLTDNGSPIVTYSAGYSYNNPLPGPTFNPNNIAPQISSYTGDISFLSYTAGAFVIGTRVNAYKCGIKVAEIWREMQIVLVACGTNSPPTVAPPFQNSNGQFTLYKDTFYAGQQIAFQIQGFDFDFLPNGSPQKITLEASGNQFGTIIPGIGTNPPTMSSSAGCINPPCVKLYPAPNPPLQPLTGQFGLQTQFIWQTNCNHLVANAGCGSSTNVYNFIFKVFDDYCPVPLQKTSTITVVVLDKVPVKAPILDSAVLIPNGNINLNWTKPVDSMQSFFCYVIYRANPNDTNFQAIDTIFNYNQQSYNDLNALGYFSPKLYFIKTLSGCGHNRLSESSDTLTAGNYALPVDPPFLHTMMFDTAGKITLQWIKPIDIYNLFSKYYIYRSPQNSNNYQLIDSLNNINITTYIDPIGQAMVSPKCYYIRTKSSNLVNNPLSSPSDTLCIGVYGSINNNNKINQIICIPNPSSGKLQISYYSTVSGEIELKISDITGKQIQSGKYNSKTGENTIQLDLSEFNDGIYFYTLKIEDEVITKKFVIQK